MKFTIDSVSTSRGQYKDLRMHSADIHARDPRIRRISQVKNPTRSNSTSGERNKRTNTAANASDENLLSISHGISSTTQRFQFSLIEAAMISQVILL